MAPATNWLSFSLSPIEMLRSADSQFVPYETSSTASPHYLLDNFYSNNGILFFLLIFCLDAEKVLESDCSVLGFE